MIQFSQCHPPKAMATTTNVNRTTLKRLKLNRHNYFDAMHCNYMTTRIECSDTIDVQSTVQIQFSLTSNSEKPRQFILSKFNYNSC